MIAPASRKLGKYEIRQKLGRGGMADVYMALDTESGALVALKLIEHSGDADTQDSIAAETRGALLQEQLAAADPRVVRVYGSGELEGYFHVAMEYIDGQDLAEWMRKGPLAVEFATDTAVAVGQTLESAHKLAVTIDGKVFHGIVHGDIKPKNIRIDARGGVRVLDFGIAKALSLSRKLTRNEFGSVPYASPERLDTGEVNVGSDLWSLAVMLYEMVTGMQPYQADSTERLERMIRSGIAPPPAPDPCPEALRRILIKAMAPDPAIRYQSAAAFVEDLTAFRTGGAVRAAAEDLDATRRTFRRDADETRRTAKLEKPGRNWSHRALRGMAALAAAGLLVAARAGVSDFRLYERGKEFERNVLSEQITDPGKIWDKWTELSKGNPSSYFLQGPRNAAMEKFAAAADHVIDTYRNNVQPVYEADWQRARTMLLHELSIDPGDKLARGKLRLVEGHLARIDGTVHASVAGLNLAVQKFTEAQTLMGRSPDPALGLARVYVYGLKDVDKAYDAFHQAEVFGYTLGNRERSQLADGYRERADRLWWDSRNVRGLPQEKDQIQQAANDYQRALDLYQESASYPNSATRISQVRTSLDSVNFRLQQIGNAEKRGPVAGAIINLLDAIRHKGTGR